MEILKTKLHTFNPSTTPILLTSKHTIRTTRQIITKFNAIARQIDLLPLVILFGEFFVNNEIVTLDDNNYIVAIVKMNRLVILNEDNTYSEIKVRSQRTQFSLAI